MPRRALRQIEKLRGSLLSAGDPILVARAPARLDVMGGIADYSGSLVLEWPLAQATVAAGAPRSDALAITHSFSAADLGLEPEVAVPLAKLCASDRTYAEVAAMSAIAAHYQLHIEPLRLARLCQIVENHVVGTIYEEHCFDFPRTCHRRIRTSHA